MTKPFHELTERLRREQILMEQDHCCARCGLDKWLENLIPLELEHKDGNNKNNERSNLELLCSNCHALTDTWRGRNKNGSKNISDEELLAALKSSPSIRQGLLKLGLSGKGNNYSRANRLLSLNP